MIAEAMSLSSIASALHSFESEKSCCGWRIGTSRRREQLPELFQYHENPSYYYVVYACSRARLFVSLYLLSL